MGEETKISWCDSTFNPWIGCTEVSPACDHCYAREQNAFRKWNGGTWGAGTPRKRTAPANWRKPILWNETARLIGRAAHHRWRVFCSSLADVFDNEVPPEWRRDLWDLIARTPHLDWLLLTKRPHAIPGMLPADWESGWPNVWLGTTVEDQRFAEIRIPALLKVPARVHFLSCEPLLGPVNLLAVGEVDGRPLSALSSHPCVDDEPGGAGIDWVIVGGESGAGARPMHLEWARKIRDQCARAHVPFFFKQAGSYNTGSARDAGADPVRWPADLRVQEFPNERAP